MTPVRRLRVKIPSLALTPRPSTSRLRPDRVAASPMLVTGIATATSCATGKQMTGGNVTDGLSLRDASVVLLVLRSAGIEVGRD